MSPAKKLIFFSFLFSLPFCCFGWGLLGHRIVGQIAASYLTPKAKLEIQKILGDESIAMSSNWADFIKSDSTYKYLDHWHYGDFQKGLNYEQFKEVLKSDTAVDVYTKLNFLIAELKKKNLPKSKKQMYLRLLIHIVGDVHQPLHVSPAGTSGGNDIKVQWFGVPSNLHRIWDSDLIDDQKLSYTEYTSHINHVTLAARKKLQADPLSKWFFESYTLAQELHDEIKEDNPRLHEPKLIILDEPFSGLDPVNTNIIKDEIYQLAQKGATIIFSTHRMEQVEEICDHIVLINKGKKILDGSVKQVKQDFKENLFSIGFDERLPVNGTSVFDIIATKDDSYVVKIKEGHTPTDVLKYFLQQNASIHSFNEILPSLNDIFIKLVEGTSVTRQFLRQEAKEQKN